MKRVYLYGILAVAVISTAGYFFLAGSNSKDPKFRTDKISRGSVVVQVRATGIINPVQTVQVGSQVSGTISRIYVDYNSHVKKNQVIAEIDSTFLYASVKEAEANLEHNQAQVTEARRTLTRTTELFKKDLVSQADLDAAKTAYESAVAQFKQTEAALDRARVNLRYAIIRAPIDGVVISRDVDVGQTVAASLQTPKLFSIANDLTHMQVEASVDEADIGQIQEGQSVSFTVDAYPDEQFHGKVAQVRLAPITVQNVVTYTVVIEVPNPDLKLRPGMTATVSILADRRDDVLRAPVLAIRFQPPQDILDKMRDQKSTLSVQPEGENRTSRQDSQRLSSDERKSGGDRGRDIGRGTWSGERGDWKGRNGEKTQNKTTRLWVLDENKNLKPMTVSIGLNDNRFVEIQGTDLKEGDEVVIGMLTAETTNLPGSQSNPFAPRMPGGGGRGR